MKKLALLILLIMLSIPATAWGAEKVFEKTFDVDPGARLKLECYKGVIKIRTGSVSSIRVNARIYPDEGPDSDLEHVTIDSRSGTNYVSLVVEYGTASMSGVRGRTDSSGILKGWNNVSLPFVDFDIVVPMDASLDIESHKSAFDVEAPSGEVKVESHKGHGTIKRIRNDFELSTHKGEFEVEIDELADLEVDTHKGEVDVVIHNATDFRLEGETDSGHLDFTGYDIRVERGDHHGKFASATIGSGEHRIELDTHKGKINLDFK